MLGPLTLLEFELDLDRVHVLFENLIELFLRTARDRREFQNQGLAIGQVPPAIAIFVGVTKEIE